MNTIPVNVKYNITSGMTSRPFHYRVYVNDELFTERTWIWPGGCLEETLLISAPAGVYPIRFETVDIARDQIKISNYRVTNPARLVTYQDDVAVEIMPMVSVMVDIVCDVVTKVPEQPFCYRIYVGDELFVERTWDWQSKYIEECFPILAIPGVYPIRIETLDPDDNQLKIQTSQVSGPGQIINSQGGIAVEISNEST